MENQIEGFYLIDKSRKRDYVKVKRSHEIVDVYSVEIAQSGVGGGYEGSLFGLKQWLRCRLTTFSGRRCKLKFVRGENILGVNHDTGFF